jgi:hypothetical protein
MKPIPQKYFIITIVLLLIAFVITLYGWTKTAKEKKLYDEYFFNDEHFAVHYFETQNEKVTGSQTKEK